MPNQRAAAQSQKGDSQAFLPRGIGLQRKCACGRHTSGEGQCSECRRRHSEGVPPSVQDVLRSPGQGLDAATRAFMEPRFGHDFSGVRVHSDTRAAESAQDVNALAYTVGRQVVFGAGQYAPETPAGRHLLAHELTHVLQQKQGSGLGASMEDRDSPFEREADNAASQILTGHAPGGVSSGSPKGLQRKVAVDKPDKLIPNPGGKGVSQTNAATIQNYLGELCSGETPKVDATSGAVSMSVEFCSVPGFQIGHEVLPAGPAPATEAATATGCTCLCDLVSSKNLWTIKVDDVSRPHTSFDDGEAATGVKPGGTGGVVTTISPNSPKVFGSVSVSGKKVDYDPWLILGHELCGHGWLGDRGKSETAEVIAKVGRQPLTIDRENALRAEHQIEARGRSFRDPFCGESYERSKSGKPGTGVFDPGLMDFCTRARARCKKPNKGLFKIEEKIPDSVPCG